MKSFLKFGLVCGVLFLSLAWTRNVSAATTTISTCAELQAIGNNASSSYQVVNDIACTGSFTPLAGFSGVLEGDGFTITGLSIPSVVNGHGLFSSIGGATIRNLKISGASVYGNFEVGILSAVAVSSTITNVSVDGTVYSGAALSLAGGLIGTLSSSTIIGSNANVTITGYSIVGGLVGTMDVSSTISQSFASGTLTAYGSGGNATAGGLVGNNGGGTISNSYSRVAVTGTSNKVGGLVGDHNSTGTIAMSYVAGPVSGTGTVGGLVGSVGTGATTTDSYWDTTVTGQMTSPAGIGTSTVNMQLQATYSGWDFASIWSMTTGTYPSLRIFDFIAPTNPGVPTSTSAVTNTTPTVTWSASTDGGSGLASIPYVIQWSTSSGFTGTIFSSSSATTSFTFASALANGSWYVRVRAHDLRGNVSNYVTSSAIVVDSVAPTMPGVPTAASPTSNTTPTVTWSASTDGGSGLASPAYYVEWSTSTVFANVRTSTASTTSFAPSLALSEGSWYFRVRASDLVGFTSTFTTSTAIVIDVTPPTLTLLGSATVDITSGETYTDAGATASDGVSGNLTNSIVTTGSVTTSANGSYTLTYNVSDAAGNAATPVTRTVTVRSSGVVGVAAGGSPVAPTPSYSSPAPTLSSIPAPTSVPSFVSMPSAMIVTAFPASTPSDTMPLTSQGRYSFTRNLRYTMRGDDVRELQRFLNAQGFMVAEQGPGSPGQETIYYGGSTANAVRRFQERYAEEILSPLGLTRGTGLFFDLTRRKVNDGTF